MQQPSSGTTPSSRPAGTPPRSGRCARTSSCRGTSTGSPSGTHPSTGSQPTPSPPGGPFILVLRRAGEHLLSLGHRTPAVVAGPSYASTALDRTAGFLAAFEAATLPVPDDKVLHSGFDVAAGHDAAVRLLATVPRPTALSVVDDDAAIGGFAAVREAGLRVGEDVAVVGYNDVPVVASLPVPMTTVRSPMHQMGRVALELLVGRLGGAPVESRRLEPTLVVRASSRPPRR